MELSQALEQERIINEKNLLIMESKHQDTLERLDKTA